MQQYLVEGTSSTTLSAGRSTINISDFASVVLCVLHAVTLLRGDLQSQAVDNAPTLCWMVQHRSFRVPPVICIHSMTIVVHHVKGRTSYLTDRYLGCWESRRVAASHFYSRLIFPSTDLSPHS